MPELISDRIWDAGDKVVIGEFEQLLFPENGNMQDCLPRNISARCAEVWNGHHVAYRCLTCGISPSSCICVACFNAGDHEGHDYFIYRSDYGGCCDCGDADAWDICGFCRYHRMAYEANKRNPCTNLPFKMKNMLRNILPVQLRRLCHHLEEWSKTAKDGDLPQECNEHIKFLLRLAQAHDGLRHIISEAFAKQQFEGSTGATCQKMSILEFSLRIGSNHLAKETELTNLFLDLMFDASFKRTFARIFLKLYPDLILNRSEVLTALVDEHGEDADQIPVGADPSSLDRVTVQLFSIRAITLELLEDPNVQLLDTLLSTTKALLLLACDQNSRVKYLVNNHSILTKRSYFQCTHDLRFVLDHQEVVDELFARHAFRSVLWNGWLEIWKIIQCANPHVRIQEDGEHVQHENQRWGNSLVFESDIHSASSSMIVTLENRVKAIDAVNWALVPLCKALRDWLAVVRQNEMNWYIALARPGCSASSTSSSTAQELAAAIKKFTPEDEEIAPVGCEYIVSKQPVSFHIPMHRIFASLMHSVCSSPNKDAIILEKADDAEWGKAKGERSLSKDGVSGGRGGKGTEDPEDMRNTMNDDEDGLELVCYDATTELEKDGLLGGGDVAGDAVHNNGTNTKTRNKSEKQLTVDTNLNSPPPKGRGTQNDSHANVEEGVSTPGVGGKKASSKSPSKTGNEDARGLFAQIVNSPKKAPAEKKQKAGVSSYLAKLERKGAPPEHDPFEGTYQLFRNTETLFRSVMGAENFTTVDLLHLMEHPLRCLVFHAQCYGFSSLWLRNGDSVAYEACFYKKNYWHSLFVDPDLTLIRLVMLALSETNQLPSFASTMLQRFEAGPRLVGHSVETLFLTLSQCLAVEPYTFKANDIERITEYHCIHILAKGPCTHSELTDTIMKSHDNSDFLDGILNDIADFQEPDAAVQAAGHRTPGKYILKLPLWRYVDTLFLLYSWKEQHEVEEKKLEKLGAKLANSFVPYRHWKEVEPYIVPCYRKGLQLIALEPCFVAIPIVSMLQACLLPVEMINHRGLQLALMLLQRLLVLVDYEKQMRVLGSRAAAGAAAGGGGEQVQVEDHNKRSVRVNVTEAGNVFALANRLSATFGSTVPDSDFDQTERHGRLTVVDAADIVIEIECADVNANCLARSMGSDNANLPVISRGPGAHADSLEDVNQHTESVMIGGQLVMLRGGTPPGSPSRRRMSGLQREPLTLENNPIVQAGGGAVVNGGAPSSRRSSRVGTPNIHQHDGLTNDMGEEQTQRGIPVEVYRGAQGDPAFDGESRLMSAALNKSWEEVTAAAHEILAEGGEGDAAAGTGARATDHTTERKFVTASSAQQPALMQFSLMQCFEAILKEPSCKQHVHVVNQNLKLLELYGLFSSEKKKEEFARTQTVSTATPDLVSGTSSLVFSHTNSEGGTSSVATSSLAGGVSSVAMPMSNMSSIVSEVGVAATSSMTIGDAATGSTSSTTAGTASSSSGVAAPAVPAFAVPPTGATAIEVDQEGAEKPEMTEAEKKKEERKRKQAAMLKKFNKKQKSFLTTSDEAKSSTSPAKTAAQSGTAAADAAADDAMLVCPEVGHQLEHQAECVICFCDHPGERNGSNPLGRMAHLQKTCVSNVPRLKRPANGSSSPCKSRKRKRLSPQKSCPVDRPSYHMAGGGSSSSVYSAFQQQTAPPPSGGSSASGGSVNTSKEKATTAAASNSGASSSSSSAGNSKEKIRPDQAGASSGPFGTAGTAGAGAGGLSSEQLASTSSTSLVGPRGRQNSAPPAPIDSDMLENNNEDSAMEGDGGELSSSEESSACEQGLEDPNLKRTAQASELIEELEPEPPAAGLYVWSCGHKIHWDCWRRLRHGTMGNTLHCPYCNHPVHIFIPVNSSVAANGIGANKALASAGGPVLRPAEAEQQDPLLAALNRSADVLDSQAAMTNLSSVAAAAGVPPAASASSTVESKPVSEEPPAPRPAPALDLQSIPAIERMRHLRMLDKQNSANQLEQLDGGLSPARGRGQRSQESEQKLSSTRQQELDLVVTVSWEEKIESLKQLEEWDQFFKSPLGYKHLTMAIKAAGNVSWSLKNRPNAVSPFYSFMDQIQNERQPIRAQYCLIPPQRSEILMHRDDHRRRGLLGGPGTLRGPRWTADLIRVAQNFQRRQQQETRAAGTTAGNDDARPVTTDHGATLQVDAQGNVTRNTAPDGGSRGVAAGAAAASSASSRVSAGPSFTAMDWSSTATAAGAGEASSSSSQMPHPQQQMLGSSSASSGGPPIAESQGSSSSFAAPLQQRFASSGSGRSSSSTATGAQQEQAPRTTTLSDREQAAQSLTSALFSAATATNAFGGSASSQEQASFVAALQQFSNFLSGPAGAALVRGADRLDRQETGLGGEGSGSASSGLGRGGGGRAGADTPDNFDVQSSRSSNGSGAVGRNASPGRGADRESSPVSNAANHSYEDADDLSFDPPGASGESGNNSSSSCSYPWVESETGEQQAKRVRTENGNAAAGATSSSSSSGVGPAAQQQTQTQTAGGSSSSSSSSSSNFFQQRAAGSAGLVQPASGDRGASGGTGTINDDGANDSGFESALEVGSACSSADTAMSSTQAPASSSAISVSSFGAGGAAPPNSNAGGTAGGAGDGAEARTDLLATGSTGRDRPFRNSLNGNGNAFFASDGRPAAPGGVSWTGQAPSRRRSEAGETGSATAIEDMTPAATTIASVPPVVGKKSESETMRMVMKSLSAHPVAILGSVLADQLRLDEIRLRAKGTFVLEPKRIEFLQGFVDAIRAYASANGAGIMSAAGNNNGPNKVPPPHPKSSVGSGAAAASTADRDLHAPPLSPPLNALPESAVSLPRSAAPGGAINALEMQQELRLLNGGRRSTDAGRDAATGSAGGGATSSSSPKMKSPEPDRAAAAHCHVDVDEPQFLATELLVRKIICTAIPCDPGVLHEWTTVGTVLSDDLATHAQTIALMHALKLIFATLESDFTFLQLPYFAPRFQTKPVVVSQPADRDGDVVMNIATVDANGKEVTKRVVGTTGASSFSAGGGNGTLQTVTSSESIMSSSGQLGANGGLLTEESGASNAEDVLSSGVEPETSNEVGTTHHPSVVGSNQRGFLLSATSQRNGNRSAASSNSSLLNHAGSSVPGIGGATPTSGGASDEGDSTSFLVGSRSGGAAGGPRSLTELLAAQFNTLERGNSASADDEEEEDLFQLFDEEDKVAREEMRREKNELRRSAEVFALTEAEAKNLVAVAILPLLRRQCLLRLVTGTGGGSRPGDKKASDSCTRESKDQQQNENLPPVDKLIREGTLKSTWDHACVLARHLGHDLDKLLLINNSAVSAASSPDAAMKYIWKKMSTAVDKWRSSARAQTRAAIEFVPSLNQRTKDEVTGRDIPYIRPRFAKNSLFIRLSAKQDYVNSYPGNYCAVTAALAMTSKNNDHIEQKLSLLAAASAGSSSSSSTIGSSTSTSTPYSVMFTNRCFYLEFHPLSYGHGSTPQLFNAAGSAASGQSTPLSGGVSVQQAAVGVTRSAMQSSTASQIAGQFVPESPRRSGVNSAVVPTSCNYNHNLGVLIKLPYLYQTLYTTYIHKQCPLCFPPLSTNVNQPKISFLCLLTGKHLCSASTFMEQYGVVQAAGGSANCENSFTKHAGKSGLGLSVLMNLLSGLVHIQKDEKMCVWGAIYLDAYGEEDRYLSRGKPLYLSQARLQQLTNALASHSFESDSKLLWKQLH